MTFEGIGVSLPGRIDATSGKFVFAPNLGWRAEDLKERLQAATGLDVSLENAANACALSEYWFGGHPEGVRNLVVVTVSEGIGVGMIINGQLVRGTSGLAGEFGHVTIDEEGPQCRCGNRGCWEVFASNSAAIRHYNETAQETEVKTYGELLALAHQGNPHASRTLKRTAEYLGKGIAMLVTGLAPDVILIVGDATHAWNMIGPIVTQIVKQKSFTNAAVKIAPVDTQSQPRLRGIVTLVLQTYFGAPAIG